MIGPPDEWQCGDGPRWRSGAEKVKSAIVRHLTASSLSSPRGVGWRRMRDCAVEMLLLAGRGKSGTWKLADDLTDQARDAVRAARNLGKESTP